MSRLRITRRRGRFHSDSSRVITRFFMPGSEARVRGLMERILAIPKSAMEATLESLLADYSTRHRDIRTILKAHYELAARYISCPTTLSADRKLFIGAYFTSEYSVESAALFNPSIVAHPDQSGLAPGALRFVISLRATGEGHISSIVFRGGVIDAQNAISMDTVGPYLERARVEVDYYYDRHTFRLKLKELGAENSYVEEAFAELDERFSLAELQAGIKRVKRDHGPSLILKETMEIVHWIAESNYTAKFSLQSALAERVIFPVARHESKGMEDARFVRFTDDDGESCYYAMYTAADGHTILPMMLRTTDFLSFDMSTLNGPVVKDKDIALFPRRVNGKFMMISRQDGENMYIMESDNVDFWHEARVLQRPEFDWELVQIGNCGSPLETEAGWLLLTHGVGPLRQYCIGAMLLDLDRPWEVIGRLTTPLIEPREHERDGYVPNVVYSCGGLIHGENLIIPYAMSDSSAGIATVPVKPLLERLLTSPSEARND